MVLAGHRLDSVDLKHETVKTYREYRYPIVMFWQPIDPKYTTSNLISTLDQHVAEDRIIYTRYGNPYKCHFGNLDHHYVQDGRVIVNSIGYCNRV